MTLLKRIIFIIGISLFITFLFFFISPDLTQKTNLELNNINQDSFPAPEFRGMLISCLEWVSEDPKTCKQNIINIMQDLQKANFNVVVFQVRAGAEVLYPSTYEPWSQLIGKKSLPFDPLQFAITEAHQRNLKLYAYMDTMSLITVKTKKQTTPNHLLSLHGPGSKDPWICIDEKGKTKDSINKKHYYLSPGIPHVHAYLRKIILDLVRRYNIDGIHLAKLQYPGAEYSLDTVSKTRFFTRGNPNRKDWSDWQREQLNKFITDLYAEIVAEKPCVVLSSSVSGIYNPYFSRDYYQFSSGYYDYFQDSWKWINLGAIDFCTPTLFWDISVSKPNHNDLLNNFYQGVGLKHVIAGQKIYGKNRKVKENIAQIKAVRKRGGPGTIIFSYSSAKAKNAFKELKKTVYRKKRPVPQFDRKSNTKKGMILGTVTDEKGQPLVDAWISIKPDSNKHLELYHNKFTQCNTSSADGRFTFLQIPSIPLKLTVEYDGTEQKSIYVDKINLGEIRKINISLTGIEQAKETVFFHIFHPKHQSRTDQEVIHLLGRTLPSYKIKIATTTVEVFSTGAFAMDNIPLKMGENKIKISATNHRGKTTTRLLSVTRIPPKPLDRKESIEILEPSKDLILLTNDVLEIKVTGPADWRGWAEYYNKKIKLMETKNENNVFTSTYFARFKIPEGFSVSPLPVTVKMKQKSNFPFFNKKMNKTSKAKVEVWNSLYPRVGETKKNKSFIEFGDHRVRLGGPFVAAVPEGTRFEIIGTRGDKYKLRLSKSLTGWISDKKVQILPTSTPIPHMHFPLCTISGDEKYDTIRISFREPIIYNITSETHPQNCLFIDFFNSHFATTWFVHQSSATIVGSVTGKQIEDNWYQLRIPLKFNQIWGYWAERDDTGLTIFIKRPPLIAKKPNSPLKGLVFAIEAGHGAHNTGAIGVMGTKEKDINLYFSTLLKKLLEEKGAKTVIMRPVDAYPSFTQRLQCAIEANADFILSIHANAANLSHGFFSDYSGVSTYYKHNHCRLLAEFVHQELNLLGLNDFGLVGNFNYKIIRTTRIPAILIEQAFLTNPQEEALLLDPEFRKKQAEAIIKGIEKFLNKINNSKILSTRKSK